MTSLPACAVTALKTFSYRRQERKVLVAARNSMALFRSVANDVKIFSLSIRFATGRMAVRVGFVGVEVGVERVCVYAWEAVIRGNGGGEEGLNYRIGMITLQEL